MRAREGEKKSITEWEKQKKRNREREKE